MSKAAQGFSLRRTDRTPQTAFSQAGGANPRRTPLIGKRAIYGWKLVTTESEGSGNCSSTKESPSYLSRFCVIVESPPPLRPSVYKASTAKTKAFLVPIWDLQK
jgi:hypothetical protein